jgi:hypothetical protein
MVCFVIFSHKVGNFYSFNYLWYFYCLLLSLVKDLNPHIAAYYDKFNFFYHISDIPFRYKKYVQLTQSHSQHGSKSGLYNTSSKHNKFKYFIVQGHRDILNLFVLIRKTNHQNKNLENLKKSPQNLCSWGVNLVEEVMAQSSGKKLCLINVNVRV